MERRVEVLSRPPVIQVGAGTGGRTALDLASTLGLEFTHLVDRVGEKILQAAQRVRNELTPMEMAGERALSRLAHGYVIAVVDNGGSLPRIFEAMESHGHKGAVITFLPSTNHARMIGILSAHDPDTAASWRNRNPDHPVIEGIRRLRGGDQLLGRRHPDGGFFNPLSGRTLPVPYVHHLTRVRDHTLHLALDPDRVSSLARSVGPHAVAVMDGNILHLYGAHPEQVEETESALLQSERTGLAVWSRDGALVLPEGRNRVFRFERNVTRAPRLVDDPPEDFDNAPSLLDSLLGGGASGFPSRREQISTSTGRPLFFGALLTLVATD